MGRARSQNHIVDPDFVKALEAGFGARVGPSPFVGMDVLDALKELCVRNGWWGGRKTEAMIEHPPAGFPTTRSKVIKALPRAKQAAINLFIRQLFVYLPTTWRAEAARIVPGPSIAVRHAIAQVIESRKAHRVCARQPPPAHPPTNPARPRALPRADDAIYGLGTRQAWLLKKTAEEDEEEEKKEKEKKKKKTRPGLAKRARLKRKYEREQARMLVDDRGGTAVPVRRALAASPLRTHTLSP